MKRDARDHDQTVEPTISTDALLFVPWKFILMCQVSGRYTSTPRRRDDVNTEKTKKKKTKPKPRQFQFETSTGIKKSPSRPKREPRPRWRPQLRTPRRLDSQRTESRKFTSKMPLMPVNTASIAAAKTVDHGAVPHRIESCCTFKNRLLDQVTVSYTHLTLPTIYSV